MTTVAVSALIYAFLRTQGEEQVAIGVLAPVLKPLPENAESKNNHPFFKEFLSFYAEMMSADWAEAT